MLLLDADKFVTLLHSLYGSEMVARGKRGPLPPEVKFVTDKAAAEIIVMLAALDLPVSQVTAEQMLSGCDTSEKLHAAILQLSNTVMLELRGRKFYGPLRRFERYYEQPKLFGDDVFDKFPSANNDIFEAGTCLALERGTACVMHLMRVCEVGIKVLAGALSVTQQNDWGAYLREIGSKLDARTKASGKRTPDEQFYAEARVTLDGVRMAWRNATMHIENNYSPERAEEILIAVRGLMRHLATRLCE